MKTVRYNERHLNLILTIMRGEDNHKHIPDLDIDELVMKKTPFISENGRHTCEHFYKKSVRKSETVEEGVVTYMTFESGRTMACVPHLDIKKVNGSTTKSKEQHHYVIPKNVTQIVSYRIRLVCKADANRSIIIEQITY